MSNIKNYGDNRILFLDISSSCTGWVVASQHVGRKEATIHKAGVIWFDPKWSHGEKYNYLTKFIENIAYIQYKVDGIVAEGYMVNRKRMCGVLVIPEATGAIKSCCYELEPPLTFDSILPQTWRAALGIKKDKTKAGSAAWKDPAKKYVNTIFPDTFPKKMVSNITGKERATPTDLYDAICIALAWFTKDPNNCTLFRIDPEVLL